MSDAELWAAWRFWAALAGVIVLVAAALLICIWVAARGILAHAQRALAAAEQIRQNTEPVWTLQTTNDVAVRLHESVDRIARKGAALAAALEGRGVTRR